VHAGQTLTVSLTADTVDYSFIQ